MSRSAASHLLLFLAVACAPEGPPGADTTPAPPFRPHLLFISLDTTRADHLSCYGYARETSPRLDELAADGHRFDAAYTVISTTLPSHAAMFTSLYPSQLAVPTNGHVVPDGALTLAERLAAEGYDTAAFISAIPLHSGFGLDQGFQTYSEPEGHERPAGATCDEASAWMGSRGEEPFFAFVHLFDPHTWYTPPEETRVLFDAPAGRLPPTRGPLQDPGQLTPSVRRGIVGAHDAEIRYADTEIGRLLDELAAAGLRERTIIVFTSDHGETLDELIDSRAYAFDHGKFTHPRELRIPLLVWLPPGFEGRGPAVHATPVSTLDYLPTLLELLGVECSGPTAGRSLVPLLRGGELPVQPVVSVRQSLAHKGDHPFFTEPEYAVTSDRFVFIRGAARPDELFDLAADPLAERNVIAAEPEVTRRMTAVLEQWQRRFAEPLFEAADEPMDPRLEQSLRALGYLGGR